MRAGVAVLFLFATSINGFYQETSAKLLHDADSCVKLLGFSKCVTAYSVWRAERAIETNNKPFVWLDYVNNTDEELFSRLCEDAERLLRDRPLTMDFGDRFMLKMTSSGNNSLNFNIIENKQGTGRTSDKKLTKMLYQALPLLIVPGMIMSTVLPFFLPTLKMATFATVMINNMALMGAIFTLLRNNAFNDRNYPKKVIYLNAGYTRTQFDPLVDAPSEAIDDVAPLEFETHYNTEVTHDTKDYHLVGVDPKTGISYPFNEEWLKNNENEQGKVKNVQIIGEVPN